MSEQQPSRKPSLLRTIKAMAWAFLGVRKGSEWRSDSAQMTPLLSSAWDWWQFLYLCCC